jgi:TP901-1 family phage major tail protein
MVAQRGKDLLLKVDSDGSGSYITIAGLRANSLAFNSGTVDVTHAESAGQWRELLAGAGVKSADISGNGIFKDAASDETVRSLFFNGEIRSWQVIIPDFGTVEGTFQLTELKFSGEYDGEVGYELALKSAGSLEFMAS